MPIAPNNPYDVATQTRQWLEYNTPNIFDASKNYTPAQTQQRYQTRVAAGEVDPRTGQMNYPTSYGGSTGIYPSFNSYGGVNFDKVDTSTYTPTPPGGAPPPGGRPPGGSTRSGGGGGGGGAGGGLSPAATNSIMALLNRKPKQYDWQNLDFQEYQPTAFRDFNSGKYDLMRSGLTDAITADRASGMGRYADARTELQQYQDPFSNANYATNPDQSAAMQRMMQANAVPTNINQADTNYGLQADQAFGNLLGILGGVAQQNQGSRMRALGGDERGFNERMDAEQRGGDLAVNMSEAQARELYEQEKWQFGEQIAQMNYTARTQNQQYNNEGVNQTAQGNTQMANEWNQTGIQTLIDLLANGTTVDPALFTGA